VRQIGRAMPRREDPRLLTGRGAFLDDHVLSGQTYGVFVRSPLAHARVTAVDVSAARGARGVVAVFTAADLKVRPIPLIRKPPSLGVELPEIPVLAAERVRWVGEPVALVVAESPELAVDAAELVDVSYEPLPAVTGVLDALDAPLVHDGFAANTCFRSRIASGDVAGPFEAAAHRIRRRIVNHRVAPVSLEPRGVLASYDPYRDWLDVRITTQRPHHTRWFIAQILGLPEHRIRVDAGDVGGAFGSKEPMYPDETAVVFAARELGRPVKWVEDRHESFLATTHGRDQVADLEVAVTADGRITAVRGDVHANMGAYLYPNSSGTVIGRTGPLLPQSYDIGAIDLTIHGVFTNTTPVGPYRGAGRPEATFYMERLIDIVASELDLDPAEVRRRNYVTSFPYRTCTGLTYDSGDYHAALDLALDRLGYAELRARQAASGKLLGIGIGSYVEIGGVTPSALAPIEGSPGLWEAASVKVHPSGTVTLGVGTCGHGQGHETTFAQIAGEALGMAPEDVTVVFGDTETAPFGFGTFGSRSAAVGGTAVFQACRKVVEKGRRVAAHLLEAALDDVEYADGAFTVRGDPSAALSFAEVAARSVLLMAPLPDGTDPGLDATAHFDPPNYTFSSGTHACAVEIDPETGRVTILRYVAVDDCGRVINPLIVDGQVHGGVAQGIGQALYEHVAYDSEGQPLTSSLMDYAVPGATQLPTIETARVESPSPANPLGVKGVGESGAIGSTPAVANAVIDALPGIAHLDMPLTPERIWTALHRS
jgi:aerobic carbon-monoxide dehydrogenase large subunit